MVCGHCFWGCSSQLLKTLKWLSSLLILCGNYSGGDSVALGIESPSSPTSIPSSPTSIPSSPTSWDLCPRLYLFGDNSALNTVNQPTNIPGDTYQEASKKRKLTECIIMVANEDLIHLDDHLDFGWTGNLIITSTHARRWLKMISSSTDLKKIKKLKWYGGKNCWQQANHERLHPDLLQSLNRPDITVPVDWAQKKVSNYQALKEEPLIALGSLQRRY